MTSGLRAVRAGHQRGHLSARAMISQGRCSRTKVETPIPVSVTSGTTIAPYKRRKPGVVQMTTSDRAPTIGGPICSQMSTMTITPMTNGPANSLQPATIVAGRTRPTARIPRKRSHPLATANSIDGTYTRSNSLRVVNSPTPPAREPSLVFPESDAQSTPPEPYADRWLSDWKGGGSAETGPGFRGCRPRLHDPRALAGSEGLHVPLHPDSG